ncbi:MAG: hypothetical protein IPJ65_03460 [Archangiaceae bacterium]|nr:hypothetical protein [Archangiaceae bacterium]
MASSQKRIPLFVVLVPLLAVLGIAGVIGFNLYRDYLKSEAEDEEARRLLSLAQEEQVRNSRAQVPVPQPKPEPVEEEDELGSLPGQKKKVKSTAPSSQTRPSARTGFKSAYEKLGEGERERGAQVSRAQAATRRPVQQRQAGQRAEVRRRL